jgi:hypothetical protein
MTTTRNVEESTAQDVAATTREIAERDHTDAIREDPMQTWAAAMRADARSLAMLEADEISEDDLEAAAAFMDKLDHTREQ